MEKLHISPMLLKEQQMMDGWMDGQLHVPAALPTGKETMVTIG
jgi:hypothetical protein